MDNVLFKDLFFSIFFPIEDIVGRFFGFRQRKGFFQISGEETPPTFSMWRNCWMILKDSILKHLTPGSSQTSDPWQRTRFRTPLKLNDSEGRERHIMKAIESNSCFFCLGWVGKYRGYKYKGYIIIMVNNFRSTESSHNVLVGHNVGVT